jgi:hypothetical protein
MRHVGVRVSNTNVNAELYIVTGFEAFGDWTVEGRQLNVVCSQSVLSLEIKSLTLLYNSRQRATLVEQKVKLP